MRQILNNKLVIFGILGLIVIIVWIIIANGNNTDDVEYIETTLTETVFEPAGEEIVVIGKIACLQSSDKPSGDERNCVKSIAGDDGKIYALNTIRISGAWRDIDIGEKVKAIGIFTPKGASTSESGRFKYDGVLDVRAVQ
jgi:hypothetical protein